MCSVFVSHLHVTHLGGFLLTSVIRRPKQNPSFVLWIIQSNEPNDPVNTSKTLPTSWLCTAWPFISGVNRSVAAARVSPHCNRWRSARRQTGRRLHPALPWRPHSPAGELSDSSAPGAAGNPQRKSEWYHTETDKQTAKHSPASTMHFNCSNALASKCTLLAPKHAINVVFFFQTIIA